VSDLADSAAALALLSRGYRPNTKLSYMSKCRAFLSYCAGADHDPLPATPATMMGYFLHKLKRGALAPPSLVKYLSAVSFLYALAGHDAPVKDPLMQLAVYGFRAHALDAAGGELRLQRMPLPAAFIVKVCDVGLSTPATLLRIQSAGLTLAFVLFNRRRAAACMRRRDVSFTAHGLTLQVVDFSMALRTKQEPLAFKVSINLTPDKQEKVAALVRLVVKQHDAVGRHPDAMLFADLANPPAQRRFWLAARVTNVWLKRRLVLFPSPAPLGGK